jgi:carbon-monoxide dehydrogenase medium subunit
MKTHFEYHSPHSLQDAVALKSSLGPDAHFWAGGTDLVLKWKREVVRPAHCIDLTAIDGLRYVTQDDDSMVRIGALTTLRELERADRSDPSLATVSRVAQMMDTVQTRSIATIGGNLCNASPAADLVPTLIALDAKVVIFASSGTRTIPVQQVMVGPGRTSLQHDEMITEIQIPTPSERRASCYQRIDRTVVDIAIVGAAAGLWVDADGCVEDARIALGAVAPTAIRAGQAEQLLRGVSLADIKGDLLEAVGVSASEEATPIDDVRASAAYRKAMARVLTRRVVQNAVEQLEGKDQ